MRTPNPSTSARLADVSATPMQVLDLNDLDDQPHAGGILLPDGWNAGIERDALPFWSTFGALLAP